MQTTEWKIQTPTIERDDELERLENRATLAIERAERAEAEASRAFKTALALAGRLERKTLQAYDKGFEAGVAFAVADGARRSEPQRRTVERDEAGRIIAIVG